jgi:cell wall-associated NlpC family hydrolase
MSRHSRRLFLLLALLIVSLSAGWAQVDYDLVKVGPGDTLASIAARFGVPQEWLVRFNAIPAGQPVKPGQTLAVPLQEPPPSSPSVSVASSQNQAPVAFQNNLAGRLGIVSAKSAGIRKTPGRGQLLYRAARGTSLAVVQESGPFYGVLMADASVGWISKSAVSLKNVALVSTLGGDLAALGPGSAALVQEAMRYLGLPYRYGGRLPYDTDCSLLVQSVFRGLGAMLPRTAAEQFNVGAPVPVELLRAGDRLYFQDSRGRINHTGIYIGNGYFIHASSRRGGVAIDNLLSSPYWRRFAGARR